MELHFATCFLNFSCLTRSMFWDWWTFLRRSLNEHKVWQSSESIFRSSSRDYLGRSNLTPQYKLGKDNNTDNFKKYSKKKSKWVVVTNKFLFFSKKMFDTDNLELTISSGVDFKALRSLTVLYAHINRNGVNDEIKYA